MATSRHAPSDDNDLLPRWVNSSNPFDISMIGRAWNRAYSNPTVHGRKREWDDEGLGNSSDTPLFSSDDHPASAEDYFAHHNKRQRRGPWWGHKEQSDRPLPRTKVKREFKRNLDSGVWMGSDSSVEDDLDILAMSRTPTAESLREIALRTPEEPIRFDGPVFPYWDDQPIDTKYFWCIQKAAAMRIEECIDDGEDTIDLSWVLILSGQDHVPANSSTATLVSRNFKDQPSNPSTTFSQKIGYRKIFKGNSNPLAAILWSFSPTTCSLKFHHDS